MVALKYGDIYYRYQGGRGLNVAGRLKQTTRGDRGRENKRGGADQESQLRPRGQETCYRQNGCII